VRACGAVVAAVCCEVCWCAAGSKTVTDLAYVGGAMAVRRRAPIGRSQTGGSPYRRYFCGSTRFSLEQLLALMRTVMCIVSSTRPEPRVYQPDPPGLIHDDPRLLPPWRGSSPFWGTYLLAARCLARPSARCGDRVIRKLSARQTIPLCTLASLSTNPCLGLVSQGHGPAG
jgi:hypothetical protein